MSKAILSAAGVVLAALCIWLTVRIVNRRERWAKRTLAALIVLMPIFYLASFGPECWWFAVTVRQVEGGPPFGSNAAYASRAYWPIGWAVDRYPSLRPIIAGYSRLFGKRSAVLLPVKGSGAEGTILWMQPS